MSSHRIKQQSIADALFTTQLGLTLAIPGWLLLMFVNGAVKRAVAREA